jgi:phenylacetate-coenzyme A ligase PaaK-like adenylate-forming protein
VTAEQCPCGRTSRLLFDLEGRADDVLPLSDGRYIHPRQVWKVFVKRDAVLRYQLVQSAPSSFLIKVSTADKNIYDGIIDGIVSDLRDLLGRASEIEAEYARGLELIQDRKFRPVVSECKEDRR